MGCGRKFKVSCFGAQEILSSVYFLDDKSANRVDGLGISKIYRFTDSNVVEMEVNDLINSQHKERERDLPTVAEWKVVEPPLTLRLPVMMVNLIPSPTSIIFFILFPISRFSS